MTVQALDTLAVAVFKNARDNEPKQHQLSWDTLTAKLMLHKERKNKDGPLWSPTLYRPGTLRGKVNVESVSCLVLDFDKGTPPAEFTRGWDGWAYVLHTTFQHTDEQPRWRVVFPLQAPVEGEHWAAAWEGLVKQFGGGVVDSSCRDSSRIYYLPACPPGAERDAWANEGRWIDASEFLRPAAAILLDRARSELHTGRNNAGMWLACQMRDNGYSQNETERLDWHREVPREKIDPAGHVDLYTEAEWLDTVRKAFGRAPRDAWRPTVNGSHPVSDADPFDPNPTEARRPRGFTAAELAVTELDDPRWAVLDYISEGLTILAGGQKLGKSWLAFDLSLAVAMGGYAFGIIPVSEGDVLYLALEDTPRRLKERLLKLLQGEPAPERLQIFTEWARIDQGGLVWIETWLKKCEAPRLVIIDTLKKIRPARAEGGNAYDEDYDFMGAIKRLADRYSIAILVLHHTRKMKADDPFDAVSGTMGLTAAADATMVLERIRGKQEAILNLTGRDIEEREVAMGWDKETGMWTIIGSAEEHRRSTERQAIVEVLRESKVPLSPKDVAEALGKNRNTVRVLMMKLATNGEIQLVTPGKYSVV